MDRGSRRLVGMSPLAVRRFAPELMDDPGLATAAHHDALAGLERINRLSATARALWRPLRRWARDGRPLRVLDVACGAGDVAIALSRRACRAGLPVVLAACDVSTRALAWARDRASARGAEVEFFQRDVLADGLPPGYDIYLCSLFLHHLREADAVTLLRRMGEGRGLLVSDLARSHAGYWAAYFGARLLSRSPVVHADAPASVAGAFTGSELRGLAAAAGLAGARVTPHWPFRLLLEWWRP